MPDIKVKTKPKEQIKKLDKSIIGIQRIKNDVIKIKEKTNEATEEDKNNSAENYAEKRVQENIKYTTKMGIKKFDEVGRKSVQETKQNIIKIKQKYNTMKTKIPVEHEIKGIINIKSKNQKTIKNLKNTSKLTKESIKTTQKVIQNTEKVAKESVKMSKQAFKVSRATAKFTAQSLKATAKSTVSAIKATVTGTKAVISAVIAGGWIAVLMILIIVLIGGFIAVVFNGNADQSYDSSQISNSEIVFVAKAQIGNVGGEKFWRWYGFREHVHWCAIFVSWCGNECGYIDKGIIPKFASCNDGINWFKNNNLWHNRSDSYFPMSGDIIFFDWYDEKGNLSGSADHVGIVTGIDIDSRTIHTIEGNTDNKCAERKYSFDDKQIMGYGSPKY